MLSSTERNQTITEQNVFHPAVTVLEEVISSPPKVTPFTLLPSSTKSIQDLFPEQEYQEKRIHRAKEILGDLAKTLTNEELKDLVVQIQYLVESWLDDFEREIFDGLTLNELLHEKGGL